MSLHEGMRFERAWRVTAAEAADRHGNPFVHALTTPVVIEWIEETATAGVQPYLPDGQGTVGSIIRMRHVAPTPIGLMVKVAATLTRIDGRRLVFQIDAFDEMEKIAECEHERVIVDLARFHEKARRKEAAAKTT
ncbi:Fluoroacetyl-CoA thioesterase [Candidatus Methylomirabilis lanthanidiphila]|uniref:Fluoroacetyl-CoA thioesterase n=1 Tax=Candidatus Methylomirabilis lanthanidiphila TaxID=2211376 RepID=A0A564ZHG7_9BACT|nr:thioesterase family protein [Candidatus Methylomirabilis lanthanidiphila]VUZ84734.1 Fluoroacetyl-CoA thioesterase [Candidatus Methylomirabilis lanthanidiphila]